MGGYFATGPGGGPVKTGGVVNFYVAADAVGASDSNPGTIAQPWSTIDHAIDVANQFDEITAAYTIHVDQAVVPYALTKTISAKLLKGSFVIIGDGAGQAGHDGFTQLLGTTSAIAGSSNVQVVTSGGLGTNTYRGKTIIMLTGAAAGDRRTIRDHNDTTIIPVRNFSAAVANNDTFRIVEPAVQINLASAQLVIADGVGGGTPAQSGGSFNLTGNSPAPSQPYFINLRFQCQTNTRFQIDQSSFVILGCEFTNTTFQFGTDGSSLFLGLDQGGAQLEARIGSILFGAPAGTSWGGWGIYAPASASLLCGRLMGFMVALAGGLAIAGDYIWITGGEFEVSSASAAVGAIAFGPASAQNQLNHICCGFPLQICPNIQIRNISTGNAALLDTTVLGKNAFVEFFNTTFVPGTGGVSLYVKGDALVTVNVCTGSGGAQGINASYGARVTNIGAVNITGNAGNDLTVDDGVSFNAVAFLAAKGDGIVNAANQSCIRRS